MQVTRSTPVRATTVVVSTRVLVTVVAVVVTVVVSKCQWPSLVFWVKIPDSAVVTFVLVAVPVWAVAVDVEIVSCTGNVLDDIV